MICHPQRRDVFIRALQTLARRFNTRAKVGIALAIAGWPVLRWYVVRLHDGSDEPFGLLAVIAAVLFLPASTWCAPVSRRRIWVSLSWMTGYSLTYSVLPPLGHALLWLGAVATVLAPRTYAFAWSTLLVLAMPLVATVQFYLGYPMRCVTTQLAAAALRVGGVHVHASGTVLNWAGERVLIDAPCAGIQMLWTLLLATAALASGRRLGNGATLRLFRWAALAVFLSNVVRAVVLFCVEERFIAAPPFGHEGIGLTLFAIAAAVLLWRAELEGRRAGRVGGGEGGLNSTSALDESPWLSRVHRVAAALQARAVTLLSAVPRGVGLSAAGFFVAIVIAAFSPWIQASSPGAWINADRGVKFPGWEAAPLPRNLFPIALGERERRFAEDFPGKIGAFTDGQSTWVVRWIEQPTRKLHPAADCLRGSGYAVTPGSAFVAADGTLWAGCSVSRERRTLRVYERIFGPGQSGWTDVSAWYWHALMGRSAGPWWAVTRLQPAG